MFYKGTVGNGTTHLGTVHDGTVDSGLTPSPPEGMLQWLYELTSPEVLDKTINLLLADLVESNGVTFDGLGDYITTGKSNAFNGDFSFSGWIKINESSSQSLILGNGGNGIRINANKLSIRLGGLDYIHTQVLTIGTWYSTSINRVGTAITITVATVAEVFVNPGIDSLSAAIELASSTDARTKSISMCCIYYSDTVWTAMWPMAEGVASGKVYDTSGNGNDGVITTGTGGLAAFWGLQDVFHNNLLDGFSLYEHATLEPLYIPYDVNGTPLVITPPSGYTKTSDNPPAIVHNGAETKIQQKAANTEFITNEFWSADGITYDKKTFSNLINHINFDDNVFVTAPSASSITNIITYPIDREWTYNDYVRFIVWLSVFNSIIENAIVYPVLSGGLEDGTKYNYDAEHVYLVKE